MKICKLTLIMGIFKRIALLFLLAAPATFASPADSLMALSFKWFSSSKAWNFDFKVRVYYAGSAESGFQSGSILVADKDRFRLLIPGFAIYSDGKNVWQWNKEQNQVLLKSLEDMEGNMHPSELLFKYLNCKPKSLKQDTAFGKKVNVIALDPSKYGKDFSAMEVWLSAKDASPVRLVTTDGVGNVSRYDILNLAKKAKVENSDFVLKEMKNVDIIDMR